MVRWQHGHNMGSNPIRRTIRTRSVWQNGRVMANDDFDDDEKFDYGSLPLDSQQEFLYNLIGFSEEASDFTAHELFWEVMYNDDLPQNQRDALYQELQEYLNDEYGLWFSDVWDWEAFREWYETV